MQTEPATLAPADKARATAGIPAGNRQVDDITVAGGNFDGLDACRLFRGQYTCSAR